MKTIYNPYTTGYTWTTTDHTPPTTEDQKTMQKYLHNTRLQKHTHHNTHTKTQCDPP